MKKHTLRSLPYILPSLLGFIVFFGIGVAVSLVSSFFAADGGWSGFSGYAEVWASKAFQTAAKNSAKFIAVGIPLLLLLSFGLAAASQVLHKTHTVGFALLFSVNLCAMVLPSSVIVALLKLAFADNGMLNSVITAFGGHPQSFMKDSTAFILLILVFLWKNYSLCMIILYAGLDRVDAALYESAEIDGAGSRQKLFHITLPLMGSSIAFALIFAVNGVFRIYRESYLLFGDYPPESVYQIQNYMNNSFYAGSYSKVSTVAAMMLAAFALVYFLAVILKKNEKNR